MDPLTILQDLVIDSWLGYHGDVRIRYRAVLGARHHLEEQNRIPSRKAHDHTQILC